MVSNFCCVAAATCQSSIHGSCNISALLGQEETIVNALVSPTGKVGFVNIATGPLSSQEEPTEVPLETAIALLKDMGASSIKYFPMKGLAHKRISSGGKSLCSS